MDDSLYSSDLDLSFTSSVATSSTSARSSLTRSSLTLSFNDSSTTTTSSSVPSSHLRPHRRHNNRHWDAVRAASALSSDGSLHLRHLKLLRFLGSGDLGRVFLCRLRDDTTADPATFALKVVDRRSLTPKKLLHSATEAEILSSLDHPFLPTLYAHLEASHYTCLLIDFCPNGDLHRLLLRSGGRLPLPAARFFAAEVLVALEYLHSQGVVYRDLKPENILLRQDGHVMLSDFDLCFRSRVSPTLTWRAGAAEFSAEPTGAFSRSCVGTHEYLSPELVSGEGHGSGVDWWAFGVLLYEMLYGTTPFKGRSKESTLRNVADSGRGVRFPAGSEEGSEEARDLIERLLVKDPRRRLGCERGATEIKRHPFFGGIKWPLIRTYQPPEVHGLTVVKRMKTKVDIRLRGRRSFWKRLRCSMRIRGNKHRLNDNQNYYSQAKYKA